MRITTQGDYALRCILAIARNSSGGPVAISRISEDERLPLDYIEQLLMKLRRSKLIKSVRGAKGGYFLNRHPARISLKDVLNAVEGETFKVICDQHKPVDKKAAGTKHGSKKKCTGAEGCVLKDVWLGLKKEIEAYLEKYTVESLLLVDRK